MRTFVLLFFLATKAYSQVPTYELRLQEALTKARNKSEQLKSVQKDTLAAQSTSEASSSTVFPRLTLDANMHYVSTVPTLQVAPNAPAIQLGAHLNYSVGPTLTYTLWDGGASRNLNKSHEKMTEARKEDQRTQTARLLASVRLAYTHVQLGLEQFQFLSDTLKLAKAQAGYISNRHVQGNASNLDLLTAKKEVLSYDLLLKQRQTELASSLRDLLALVESDSTLVIKDPTPKGFPNAGLWITLDSLDETLKKESSSEPSQLDDTPPQVRSQDLLAESFELLSKSQRASMYPRLQISGRTSLDYPNGPILERIHQNTLAVGFSMPLYEFSRTEHLAATKMFEAEAARHRKNQIASDLQRDFAKAKDTLRSLRGQDKDAKEVLKQAEQLSKMYYDAYRLGRITLIEVQSANLRALQAKVDLSQIHAQILNQLSTLKTLAIKDELL